MPMTPEGARFFAELEMEHWIREQRARPLSERDFATEVINILCREGWSKANNGDYVRTQALKVNSLVNYVRKTQPGEWAKIEGLHGQQARELFLRRVFDELEPDGERGGVVNVLRHGIRMEPGAHFRLCGFRPSPDADPNDWACYKDNRFEVVSSLGYGTMSDDADSWVDVALFINGIPVVTLEIQNSYTGHRIEEAVARYKREHNPEELLFKPNRRSIVHFALDCETVEMCTWLAGDESCFKPFDLVIKAHDEDNVRGDGYPTAFLPSGVLVPNILLEIIRRFVRVELDPNTHEMSDIVFPG